jgi:hypothetical protein
MTMSDISITGAKAGLPRRDRKGTETVQVHFKLSEAPPRDWVSCFDEVRRSRLLSCLACVAGGVIVLECPLEGMRAYFRELREDVDDANAVHRQRRAEEAVTPATTTTRYDLM